MWLNKGNTKLSGRARPQGVAGGVLRIVQRILKKPLGIFRRGLRIVQFARQYFDVQTSIMGVIQPLYKT